MAIMKLALKDKDWSYRTNWIKETVGDLNAKLNWDIIKETRSRLINGETRKTLSGLYNLNYRVMCWFASNEAWFDKDYQAVPTA